MSNVNRQIATAEVIGKSVTITRVSHITGKPVTRTVVIVGSWDSYRGTAAGMPVILDAGLDRKDVLSIDEQATIH